MSVSVSATLEDMQPTAIHEAGHAVVAERLGRRVNRVRLENFQHGWTDTQDVALDRPERLDEEIMIALAGPAAVAAFGLEAGVDEDEDEADINVARRHARQRVGDLGDVEAHLKVMQLQATGLIHDSRVEVQSVAEQLRGRRELSGNELRELTSGTHQ